MIEFDCTLWKRKWILTYMGPGISATSSSLRAGCRDSVYDSGFGFLCANPPFTRAAQTLFAEQWQSAMFCASSTSWESVIHVTNLLISSAGYGAMSSCADLVSVFRCCFHKAFQIDLSWHFHIVLRYVPLSNLLSVWWIEDNRHRSLRELYRKVL